MGEARIPDKVLDALVENTKVIDSNNEVIERITQEEENGDLDKKNIIKDQKVKPILTPMEKKRYAAIGKELMAPFLKSLKDLIALEKKKSEMIIEEKVEKVEKETDKQYKEKKGKKGGDIMELIRLLLPVAMVLGVVIYKFKEKIEKFFSEIWGWIKDFFKPVMEFFDFSSPISPMTKIWDTITSFLGKVWDGITVVWNDLTDFAGKIWEKAVDGWNVFLNKINEWWEAAKKVWDDFVQEVKDYYNWVIDKIANAINSLTSGTKKLFSWFSSDDEEEKKEAEKKEAEKKVVETKEEVKVNPAQDQAKQNIELLTDSLKDSVASSIVDQLSDKLKIDGISEEEREKYNNLVKKHLSADRGKLSVNLEAVQQQLKEEAKKGAVGAFGEKLAELSKDAADTLNKGINEEINKDEGMEAVHQTIFKSASLIKEAFGNYNKQISENFAQSWRDFMDKYMERPNYTIMPVHKESFEKMSNEMLRLANESAEMITQQNAVLEKIRDILSVPPPPPAPTIIVQSSGEGVTNSNHSVSAGAKRLAGKLWAASSHWP